MVMEEVVNIRGRNQLQQCAATGHAVGMLGELVDPSHRRATVLALCHNRCLLAYWREGLVPRAFSWMRSEEQRQVGDAEIYRSGSCPHCRSPGRAGVIHQSRRHKVGHSPSDHTPSHIRI